MARNIYSKSLHPQHGYPFAIVGIHLTASIHKLLNDGILKTHFYNDSESPNNAINVEDFHGIFGKNN